jgi:threonine/homoserine/homoserine lactone efflux protein
MLPTGHLLAFALLSFGIAVVSDGTWAVAAGTARAWLGRSPRRLELIGGTGGLVMIGIGASLAITGRKD